MAKQARREYALKKLATYLANPTYRTLEENAPQLRLKNGRRLMIEVAYVGSEWPAKARYVVSRDFGSTCREIGHPVGIEALLDLVLVEGGAG